MDRYASLVKNYLKEEEPERYQALIDEDYLDQFCQSRAKQAQHEKNSLIRAGFSDHEANEVVMKDLLILP